MIQSENISPGRPRAEGFHQGSAPQSRLCGFTVQSCLAACHYQPPSRFTQRPRIVCAVSFTARESVTPSAMQVKSHHEAHGQSVCVPLSRATCSRVGLPPAAAERALISGWQRSTSFEKHDMQAFYAENFDREMGCSENEWLGWLPNAIGLHPYKQVAQAVTASIDAGKLTLSWRVSSPRTNALARTPRLLVSFRFSALDDLQRYRFMKRFDLHMQRGGG